MIGERIVDRRLVTVIAGQVEYKIEIARQCSEHFIRSDRLEHEVYRGMFRHVADIGRQQIINYDQAVRLQLQEPPNEGTAYETSTAHDKNRRPGKRRFCHDSSAGGGRKWLWITGTPWVSYQRTIRAIDSERPSSALQPRTARVRDGSSTTAGTSSAAGGTIRTGLGTSTPRQAAIELKTSTIAWPSPVEALKIQGGALSRSTILISGRTYAAYRRYPHTSG